MELVLQDRLDDNTHYFQSYFQIRSNTLDGSIKLSRYFFRRNPRCTRSNNCIIKHWKLVIRFRVGIYKNTYLALSVSENQTSMSS